MKEKNKLYTSFIAILILCISAIACVFSEINFVQAQTEEVFAPTNQNLNKTTEYNLIKSPKTIAIVSDLDFYLSNNEGHIYHFNSSDGLTLQTKSFSTLVDMCWFDNALYILLPTSLIKYIPANNTSEIIVSTNLNDAKALAINTDGIYIASSTNIIFLDFRKIDSPITYSNFETESIPYTFSNILDITLTDNKSLNILHSSNLDIDGKNFVLLTKLKINNDFTALDHIFSKTISTASGFDIKINSYLSSIFICKDSKIYIINDNELPVSDIFSNTPLIEPILTQISFKSSEIHSISSFGINGNKILICDDISNSVQSFKFENNSLNFEKLLIATSGADDDRLYMPKDINLNQNDTIYILDAGNHRIIEKNISLGKNTSIINIVSPQAMATNSLGNIYVVSKGQTSQMLTIFNNTNSTKTTIEIKNKIIDDIEVSTTNQVYFLDSTNKKIYILNENNELDEFISLTSLSLNSSAKIKTNAIGNKLYLFADNSIYSTDLSQNNMVWDNEISMISGKIIDFIIDYVNNIYVLIKDSNKYILDKYSNLSIKQNSVTLPESNYSQISLNLVTGEIYFINEDYHRIEILTTKGLINVLKNYSHDTSFKNNPPTNGANIAKIKNDCQSFKHPFSVQPLINLNKDDLIIVLKNQTTENPNFAYVMIANKEKKNILAYVKTSDLDYQNIEDIKLNFNRIVINTPIANIYYLPTGQQFEGEDSTCKLYQAKQGETYEVLGMAYGYKDYSEISFYEVKLENGSIGYIKAPYAHNADSIKPTVTLQSDARVEKVLANDIIYVYYFDESLNEYVQTKTTLQHGQYIQLIDKYDANLKFLEIKYQDEDDSTLKTGYVETKFVVYEDITWLKIVGIIVLILGIILLAIAGTMIGNYIKKQAVLKTDYENNIPNQN